MGSTESIQQNNTNDNQIKQDNRIKHDIRYNIGIKSDNKYENGISDIDIINTKSDAEHENNISDTDIIETKNDTENENKIHVNYMMNRSSSTLPFTSPVSGKEIKQAFVIKLVVHVMNFGLNMKKIHWKIVKQLTQILKLMYHTQ